MHKFKVMASTFSFRKIKFSFYIKHRHLYGILPICKLHRTPNPLTTRTPNIELHSVAKVSSIEYLLCLLIIYYACLSYYACFIIHNFRAKLYLIGEKKTGHKIKQVKLLVGETFSHLHIQLVTFPRLNFAF